MGDIIEGIISDISGDEVILMGIVLIAVIIFALLMHDYRITRREKREKERKQKVADAQRKEYFQTHPLMNEIMCTIREYLQLLIDYAEKATTKEHVIIEIAVCCDYIQLDWAVGTIPDWMIGCSTTLGGWITTFEPYEVPYRFTYKRKGYGDMAKHDQCLFAEVLREKIIVEAKDTKIIVEPCTGEGYYFKVNFDQYRKELRPI